MESTRSRAFKGYSTREVAKLLDLSAEQVYSYVRAADLDPRRGARGELRFSFQDLVLLRTVRALIEARIPSRRVRRALGRLKEQLPRGRPLTSVRIGVEGQQIVVRDESELWDPESGQGRFDFQVSDLAAGVEPLAREAAAAARERQEELAAEDWYELGYELETSAADEARDAYRRALELEPEHPDAHLNLGRLLHEDGDPAAAAEHYRSAVRARPSDATAHFNLGVALEDLGRPREAAASYRRAIGLDPAYADAHYNLAGLAEREGDRKEALQHLQAYRRLRR